MQAPGADVRKDPAGAFASASSVVAEGEGQYRVEIPEGWDIAGNLNGGYLLATAGRAMAEAVDRPNPISLTAHYLAPGRAGPAEVAVETVRVGRRFTTARATLSTAGRPTIAVLGTFGDLGVPAEHPELVLGAPPPLPAPADCPRIVPDDPFPPPFMSKVELRLHPEDAGFFRGSPSGTPRLRGWFALPDGERIDTIALLLAVDSFPPTIFNTALPLGWVPTLELTAHVRARPAEGWLACDYSTRFISGGMLEVDGEVWDSTGTLVAQSRQIALMPRST